MNKTPNLSHVISNDAAQLLQRINEARANAAALIELWITLLGEPAPSERQFFIWLTRYGFQIVVESIHEVSAWLNKHNQELERIREEEDREPAPEEYVEHTKSLLDLIRYVSGIMKRKAERDGQA